MQLRRVRPARRARAGQVATALCALVIAVGGSVLGATAAGANPGISVTPSTGLHDGQVVTVTGSGFPKSQNVYIVECQAGASKIGECAFTFSDLNTVVVAKTDGSGNLNSPSPTLKTSFKGIDCTKTACEIAAHVGTQAVLTATNTATHSISFGSASHPSSSHSAPASHTAPAGSSSAGQASSSAASSGSTAASHSSAATATGSSGSTSSGPASATASSSAGAANAPSGDSSPSDAAGSATSRKADNGGRYLVVLLVGLLGVLFVGAMAVSGRRARG